ncbi:MAG: copper oxidase [Gammaproteobacteria bacterium RIFCSPHIGHO2_12_FULL_36_30]|nr:MAG: copper oxidase [Gammaproteobacteria bacterium RIFCSPHIGHO2_12_FULL_36_30]
MLKLRKIILNKYLYFIIFCFVSLNIAAANRIINLNIGYKTVNFTGKKVTALAINNQIPGPTLYFKEDDHVTINVFNHLKTGTTIHWHGLLVPWQMDGVESVSQNPIPPGGVFHYHFTLRQAGTYWYHSHAGLQEQEGLYGAIVIRPNYLSAYHANKDYVVVLSDWSNIPAEKILADLKKSGDYFSPNFPLQPSLMHFIHSYHNASPAMKKEIFDQYWMMQTSRMSPYDLSDVAYDAFLLNGKTKNNPWTEQVKVGDTIRLRFIGAAASTIFYVKIPGSVMRIIQVDGNDVRALSVHHFTIAPGETYDVLVKIKKSHPYYIYAESNDTVGAAVGVLLTKAHQSFNVNSITPFPKPKPTMQMPANTMQNSHSQMQMNSTHSKMSMSSAMPSMPTAKKPYQNLIALYKTNNPHKKIAKIIHMNLSGWMDRYIWFINGKPEYLAKPIILKPGLRYRFIFKNESMMYHPMHIHGHWFILRDGHGAYDPLLHTILVQPGATVIADVDADASGQWFFHCHMLYHMMAGMSRVFQYNTILKVANNTEKPEHFVGTTGFINRPIVREDETRPLNLHLIHHPAGHMSHIYFSNFLDVGEDFIHNIQLLNFKGYYGSDYHKLELQTKDAELNKGKVEAADVDIFYYHPISEFWAIKGGANYTYRPAQNAYWQPGIGLEGLMPFFIDTDLRLYNYAGSFKFDFDFTRDTQITNNFFISLEIRSIFATKTVASAEIGDGLNQMQYVIRPYYRVAPGVQVYAQYEFDKNYGEFANFQSADGDSVTENITTLGVAVLF